MPHVKWEVAMFELSCLSQSIQNELTTFGLNPDQWRIFVKRNKEIHFFHKKDKHFQMKAFLKVNHSGQIVDRLQIVSI